MSDPVTQKKENAPVSIISGIEVHGVPQIPTPKMVALPHPGIVVQNAGYTPEQRSLEENRALIESSIPANSIPDRLQKARESLGIPTQQDLPKAA